MTGDDTYTPENDLNLSDDLTSPSDTYTPENDLNLTDDLASVVFDAVLTTASASGTGLTVGITGISTPETTGAAITASGANLSISGSSTLSTQTASVSATGGSTQIDASQTETLDISVQAEIQATGLTTSISGSSSASTTAASASAQGDTSSISGGTTATALTSTATLSGEGSTIDLAQKETLEVPESATVAGSGGQASVSGSATPSTISANASNIAETIQIDLAQKETFEVSVGVEVQATGEQTSISGSTSASTLNANITGQGDQIGISGSSTLDLSTAETNKRQGGFFDFEDGSKEGFIVNKGSFDALGYNYTPGGFSGAAFDIQETSGGLGSGESSGVAEAEKTFSPKTRIDFVAAVNSTGQKDGSYTDGFYRLFNNGEEVGTLRFFFDPNGTNPPIQEIRWNGSTLQTYNFEQSYEIEVVINDQFTADVIIDNQEFNNLSLTNNNTRVDKILTHIDVAFAV